MRGCRGHHPEGTQSVRQRVACPGQLRAPLQTLRTDAQFEVTYTKDYHYWEFAIFILLGVFGVSFWETRLSYR